jgi:hypothetical protein
MEPLSVLDRRGAIFPCWLCSDGCCFFSLAQAFTPGNLENKNAVSFFCFCPLKGAKTKKGNITDAFRPQA